MIRKKHLKAMLADERALNDSLQAENASVTQLYYETKQDLSIAEQEHLRVLDIARDLEAANRTLASKATAYAAANASLRAQLETARRSFGEAFVKGNLSPTGPSRPNRKKLTDAEVRDIRDAYYGGAKQKDLAEKFGVNPATISRTVRGVYH
uniref:Helix-turn-helix DNA binding protein n=1 Tax=Mycobacterium phage BabyBack TaxID=3158877 RepID=A0AAU8GQR2_9CAUD